MHISSKIILKTTITVLLKPYPMVSRGSILTRFLLWLPHGKAAPNKFLRRVLSQPVLKCTPQCAGACPAPVISFLPATNAKKPAANGSSGLQRETLGERRISLYVNQGGARSALPKDGGLFPPCLGFSFCAGMTAMFRERGERFGIN